MTRTKCVSRKELYAKVKELKLEDAVKAMFGKNFTQVSNKDLEEFVTFRCEKKKANTSTSTRVEKKSKVITIENCKDNPYRTAIVTLVTLLDSFGVLDKVLEEIKPQIK